MYRLKNWLFHKDMLIISWNNIYIYISWLPKVRLMVSYDVDPNIPLATLSQLCSEVQRKTDGLISCI